MTSGHFLGGGGETGALGVVVPVLGCGEGVGRDIGGLGVGAPRSPPEPSFEFVTWNIFISINWKSLRPQRTLKGLHQGPINSMTNCSSALFCRSQKHSQRAAPLCNASQVPQDTVHAP